MTNCSLMRHHPFSPGCRVGAGIVAALVLACSAPGDDTPPSRSPLAAGRADSAQPGVVAATEAARAATDTAWLLGADPRDDAVRASDTEATLVARYGAANVRRDAVDAGEGMLVPGTVLFPGDARRRLEIQWGDTIAYRHPTYVTAAGDAWLIHPGIGLGTSLRELERLNGSEFELSGLRGHSAGTVTDWRSGRLAPLGALTATGYSRVLLRLQPQPPYPSGADTEPYESEGLFLSSDPGIQLLNPRVVVMVIEPR